MCGDLDCDMPVNIPTKFGKKSNQVW